MGMQRMPWAVHGTLTSQVSINRRYSVLSATIRPVALVASDLTAFVISTMAAFLLNLAAEPNPFVRAYDKVVHYGLGWQGWGIALVFVLLLAYFGGRGHYTCRIPFWIEARTVLCATAFAFVGDGIISVVLYHVEFGTEGMVRWLIFVPITLAIRQGTRQVLGQCGIGSVRTIVVGDANLAAGTESALRSEPALGYELVGRITPDIAPAADDAREWIQLIARNRVDFVVVVLGGSCGQAMRTTAATLARARIPLAVVPPMEELPVQGFRQHYFISHDVLMLTCQGSLTQPVARMMKLVLDQVGAAILLFLLAPLFIVLISLVRMDGGPAFFRHTRIGAGGRRFGCIKFRTMVTDADVVLREFLARDPNASREWRETQKLRADPRVTPIGRFLRQTSLDELPQLINVLRGEMSLVGPRPIVEAEITRYGDYIVDYYNVRPGITGLWQVSGRSDISYQQRVRLDRWYARNWTLWHDVAILAKTIPAVLRRSGAV